MKGIEMYSSHSLTNSFKPSEYARVTRPNAVRLLSAKIAGVVMSANFSKPGVYDHDNAHVAQALRALADIIEKAPVPLADNDIALSVSH
jgi:hypothetical protein